MLKTQKTRETEKEMAKQLKKLAIERKREEPQASENERGRELGREKLELKKKKKKIDERKLICKCL